MISEKKRFIISVYAPLGGQGASFIATQLVHQLARFGPSCLLDLNLDHSTSLHYMNLEPVGAFRKTARETEESALLSSFAIKVEDNYFAVGAPLFGYGQFATETSESVQDLFELCKAEFDYTVVDLPRPLHVELTKSVLLMSDLILAISENTDHSARACLKLKKILLDAKMGVNSKKLCFLFNRSVTQNMAMLPVLSGGLLVLLGALMAVHLLVPYLERHAVFAGACLMPLIWMSWPRARDRSRSALSILAKDQIAVFHDLPHDARSCRSAINQGTFLDEKTRMGKSLIDLAGKIKGFLIK